MFSYNHPCLTITQKLRGADIELPNERGETVEARGVQEFLEDGCSSEMVKGTDITLKPWGKEADPKNAWKFDGKALYRPGSNQPVYKYQQYQGAMVLFLPTKSEPDNKSWKWDEKRGELHWPHKCCRACYLEPDRDRPDAQ